MTNINDSKLTTIISMPAVSQYLPVNKLNTLKKTFQMDYSSRKTKSGSGPAIYGLGFVGALIYFLQGATTFWIGVIGFFKALAWPAFLVYYLLEFLKK